MIHFDESGDLIVNSANTFATLESMEEDEQHYLCTYCGLIGHGEDALKELQHLGADINKKSICSFCPFKPDSTDVYPSIDNIIPILQTWELIE
jgi:hypothetical protein